MFTIEQLKAAHAKVKTGSDYPYYIKEIKLLGVKGYQTYVADGNAVYEGNNNYKIQSGSKYQELKIVETSNRQQFLTDLKAHQQGKSDFSTFCRQCADSGIEKWVADLEKMTCTYYDKAQNSILVETIPGAH